MRLLTRESVSSNERAASLRAMDLELIEVQSGDAAQAAVETWVPVDVDDDSEIHFVNDIPIGLEYFVIDGKGEWGDRLRDRFPILQEDEILARLRQAKTLEQRIATYFQIALIAPEVLREDLFEILRAALQDSEPEVRHAAVLAVAYTNWPEFQPILSELSHRDTSEKVRNRARILLESVAKHGWNTGGDDEG